MNELNYSPLTALLTFLGIVLLLFLLFRPGKGWFWLIQKNKESSRKVIIEDILKLLYHSENEEKSLNLVDITRTLKDPDDLIIDSINEMAEHELINLEGEHVKLTQAGSEYGLRIVRAHRLWEKFLAEKTGFAEADWHKIAEQKEHELSDADTDKLSARLGNPQFDPHGDPIPTNTGKMANVTGTLLSEMEVNSFGRIVHIKDKPDIVYRQILAENIHIGSHIRIVEKNANRVVFHSEGEAFVLAPIVAGNITVTELKKDVKVEENIARLSMLTEGETAEIIGISKEMRGESRRRLLDLGFVKGAKVSIELPNPLGEPKAFLIKGTSIALRNNQASKILILKD